MSAMRIGIIGGGQMGAGIAQVCAAAGNTVHLFDRQPQILANARQNIARRLERSVGRGTITAESAEQTAARIIDCIDLTELSEFDPEFVIEAVPEHLETKLAVFERLHDLLAPTTILASNTSSISITALATATSHPERVVGMHFMHPVPVMDLVEIVRGERTSPQTIATTTTLAKAVGKTPVAVEDMPGFIANRILMPMINEAIFALAEGTADAIGIDTIMQLGMNHPMGPLALADFIGLDTCLAILEVLQREFGDSKYRPAPLLRRYVTAGKLGRKCREGFYRYAADGTRL